MSMKWRHCPECGIVKVALYEAWCDFHTDTWHGEAYKRDVAMLRIEAPKGVESNCVTGPKGEIYE